MFFFNSDLPKTRNYFALDFSVTFLFMVFAEGRTTVKALPHPLEGILSGGGGLGKSLKNGFCFSREDI